MEIEDGTAIGAKHYQLTGAQPIEIMQNVMTAEEFVGFLRGNICETDGIEEEGYCYCKVAENSTIREHFRDAWETFGTVKSFPPAARTFGKVIWPMLCKVLREEMEQQPCG